MKKALCICALLLTLTFNHVQVLADTKIPVSDSNLSSGIYYIDESGKYRVYYTIDKGKKTTIIILNANKDIVFKSGGGEARDFYATDIDSSSRIIIVGDPVYIYFMAK